MTQVWLITGTSRGLGRHLAQTVLDRGDHLVATARDPQRLGGLAQSDSDRVHAVALDVTDPRAADAAVAAAIERFGRLDVVVNNAGYADFGAIEDIPDETLHRQVDTVFWGVVNVTRAALPVMRGQRNGRIVQVSSMGARMGSPGLAVYQAAKAAVTVFSMSLAKEVAHLGISVTVVEPGNLRTDITSANSMQMLPFGADYRAVLEPMERYLRDNDGRQSGDPVKAAEAIVELATMADPPLRVPLGSDALRFAATAADELAAGDRATESLSRSIDFADLRGGDVEAPE